MKGYFINSTKPKEHTRTILNKIGGMPPPIMIKYFLYTLYKNRKCLWGRVEELFFILISKNSANSHMLSKYQKVLVKSIGSSK